MHNGKSRSGDQANSNPIDDPGETPTPEEAVNLQKVLVAERAEIESRRKLVFRGKAVSSENLTALSLSGGGIRSACFNLGLLEGLDRLAYRPESETARDSRLGTTSGNHLELFDYLSSVSGGSYAAGHLATAMLPSSEHAAPEAMPPSALREGAESNGDGNAGDS
ncbi:MAG TPA: hypothetical protein VFT74_14850, partial [Isosphaeraceae bacterium]|nr:hypothetical protein [Isosphaeraceae bacterium]